MAKDMPNGWGSGGRVDYPRLVLVARRDKTVRPWGAIGYQVWLGKGGSECNWRVGGEEGKVGQGGVGWGARSEGRAEEERKGEKRRGEERRGKERRGEERRETGRDVFEARGLEINLVSELNS
eukprot:746270-Hanusia_phi.AAC.1